MMGSRRFVRLLVGAITTVALGPWFGPQAHAQSAPDPDTADRASNASTASDDKVEAPIAYQFNDPNPWVKNSVYTVYQTGEDTVVVRHPAAQKLRFDTFDPSKASTWYAGKASDGQIARVLQAQRPVLVKPNAGDYQPGKREQRRGRGGVSYVSYDKLETKLVRGGDDREIAGHPTHHYVLKVSYRSTRFDAHGEQTGRKNHAFEHQLWIAEDLPYSPAFALPYRVIGRLFVEDDDTSLGEYVLGQVRDKIRQKGLVLGMEFRRKGDTKAQYKMEASALRKPRTKLAKLPAYPVVDDATFSKIAPVTILSRMLEPTDAKAARESTFELTYSGASDGKIKGTAVYGTNEHGDFALLLRFPLNSGADSASQPRRQLFLLLMRPMHGLPAKGEYAVGDMADDLETLPDEKLEELSKLFTVMGVVREQRDGDEYPTIYALLDVDEGGVSVSDGEKGLEGSIDLKLEGVELADDVSPAKLHLKASFQAREGLANVGSSKITQVLTR